MRALALVASLALPATADACATCIASPFGDRTYSWPYLLLILLPLVVSAVIGAILMRATGTRLSDVWPWLRSVMQSAPPPPARHKETT